VLNFKLFFADHCHVAVEDEGDLGVWLLHKRYLQRQGELPLDQESELAALGVVFDMRLSSFLTRYELLKEFVELFGADQQLPRTVTSESFRFCRLWSFMWAQRDLYKRGKLDPAREKMIRDLGIKLELSGEDDNGE